MHLFQMCRWYRPQKQLKLDITRAITVSSKKLPHELKMKNDYCISDVRRVYYVPLKMIHFNYKIMDEPGYNIDNRPLPIILPNHHNYIHLVIEYHDTIKLIFKSQYAIIKPAFVLVKQYRTILLLRTLLRYPNF